MSLTDDLAAANTSLINFHTKFKQIASQKKPTADMAKDASAFNGVTPAAFLTDLTSNLTTHIANKNNPHGDSAVAIGAMKREDFDTLAAGYTDQGLFAVSQIGSLTYLPLGVSGSFEGSTTVKTTGNSAQNNREIYNFQLETDGTLVWLRNGTNGSKQGVFYGYMPGADVTLNASSKMTPTNKRYAPPFLPANNSVAYLYQGGQGALAGRYQDGSGNLGNCFIALTGNTLDSTGHLAVSLDATTWDSILNLSEIVLCGNNAYIFYHVQAVQGTRTAALDISVWRIPISSFAADGPTATPTRVTVGQCTGFMGKTFNTGDIRLADQIEAADLVTSAVIQHDNAGSLFSGGYEIPGSGRSFTFSMASDDQTQIRCLMVMDGRWQAPGMGNQQSRLMFSFVCDIASLSVTLDSGMAPMVITNSNNGTTTPLVFTGPILGQSGNEQSTQLFAITGGVLDLSCRPWISDTGIIFSSQIAYGDAGQDVLCRVKAVSYTSRFDLLKCPIATTTQRYRASVPITYGSAVGDALDGVKLLPDNVLVCLGRGITTSGVLSTGQTILARYADTGVPSPPTNYTYSSLTNGVNIAGYKPRTERAGYNDAPTMDLFRGVICNVTDSAVVTNGTFFYNKNLRARPTIINNDMTTSGSNTVDQTALENAAKAAIAAEGFAWPGDLANSGDFVVELIVPQNTSIPCWISVYFNHNDRNRRHLLYLVTVNARIGNITTVTLGAKIAALTYGVGPAPVSLNMNDSYRGNSVYIYPASGGEGWMVYGHASLLFTTGTGSGAPSYRFFINTNGSTEGAGFLNLSAGVPGQRYMALPGLGMGSIVATDYGTKLMFRRIATTKAEFLTFNTSLTPVANARILLAQDVAEGWTVYFNEDTPVTIAGTDYILTATSLDLSVLFPGAYTNRTFYLYVGMSNGVPQWKIDSLILPESTNQIFVGTITTGASGITAINTAKVTRIGNFRVSLTAAGSSIPVTGGTPDVAQSLPW